MIPCMNTPINPGAFGPQPQVAYHPTVRLAPARPSRFRRVLSAFGAVIVPALLLAVSISCFQFLQEKRGSGNVVTEERILDVDVQGVELAGSPVVNVTVDPAAEQVSVQVTTDDNLLMDIRTEVKNGILRIDPEGSLSPTKGIRVDVTVRSLSSAGVTGSGNITAVGIAADSFRARVTGSGDLTLRGSAQSAEYGVTGSGDLDAENLDAARAKASITGSGDITLKAREAADVKVTGSGDITVVGQPPKLTRNVTGSGDIHVR